MKALLAAAVLLAGLVPAAAQTEIRVQFPNAGRLQAALEKIAADFTAANADVKVRYLAPAESYGDILQRTLRSAVTGDLPDVAFLSLNNIRVVSDRNIAVNLKPFVAAEPNWKGLGYDEALMSLAEVRGNQYGLAFAVSIPLIFYNLDLVKRAGGDPANLPDTWEKLADLSARIAALEPDTTGTILPVPAVPDWFWQTMVNAQGGTMMNAAETAVAFNGPAGQRAMGVLTLMIDKGKSKNMDLRAAMQTFFAGKAGMMFGSSALIGGADRSVGNRFTWTAAPTPLAAADARYPAGGNAAVMLAKDPERQKAAWKYMKYATGIDGSITQAQIVGYIPGNYAATQEPSPLAKFYRENPVYGVSARQIPKLTGWYAYPGENGQRIIKAIDDNLAKLFAGQSNGEQTLAAMTSDVERLLK